MNIIFFGPPGSGKGTQASIISKKLNIPAISTGEILRSEVNKKTELGDFASSFINTGQLVPDDLVVKMISNRISLEDCCRGFILDGFPRNYNQAFEFQEMLYEYNKKLDLIVKFDISSDVLMKRITGRFSCGNCLQIYNKYFKRTRQEGICDECGSKTFVERKDDNESVLRDRLIVYEKEIYELTKFYQKNILIILIDALQDASLISDILISKISYLKS